ncbi:hypothetical protein [Massilia sp. IC2-476]|uniref:hypothetical protein n=1 Tax=Massilia sp. IC2-476 TaxID=2887199 RepID=UPI001D0FB06D|nr:hypothetical protein [Massilia sp. IC2-476]MCC2972107.1 hypothetical protein [Massilia sp. IC2-476]
MSLPSGTMEPLAQLNAWKIAGIELGFVYLRQGGGLIQTGRAQLTDLDDSTLKLASGTCTLLVMHLGASLTQEPQWFFEPNLNGAYQVEGIGIALPNHDWLFLSEAVLPERLALSAGKR